MKLRMILILCTLLLTKVFSQATDKVGIVFHAPLETINDAVVGDLWLDAIETNWGATGVQLRPWWKHMEPTMQGVFNWNSLETALDKIRYHGLDISIFVPMGLLLPKWADFNTYPDVGPDNQVHEGDFELKDFHVGYNDEHIWRNKPAPAGEYKTNNRFFNLTSDAGINAMKSYYEGLLIFLEDYVVRNATYFSTRNTIEVIPNTSLHGEMELNPEFGNITGYSEVEIDSFQYYLNNIYPDITDLNATWGSSFSDFADIDPKDFDWYTVDDTFNNYQYSAGRVDWINFKFGEIKKFVDDLADMTTARGFNMGVQLGSIYDFYIDHRGILDPTSLLENTHALRVGDIKQFRPYFDFAADYARSICEYWDRQPSSSGRRGFSSDSNWHLYNYIIQNYPTHDDNADNARELATIWTEQVTAYHERGADKHVIFGWGHVDDAPHFWATGARPTTITSQDLLVGNSTIVNTTDGWYKEFIDKLKSISINLRKPPTSHQRAVHLSVDYFSTIPPRGINPNEPRFHLANSVMFKQYPDVWKSYEYPGRNYQPNDCDIITNYMITHTPGYLNLYDNPNYSFSLTESSQWMPDEVYLALMTTDINDDIVTMTNATHIYDNGHAEFVFTPGIKNQYGQKRSPIHLIWRSRRDLMTLFPSANLPDPVILPTYTWWDGTLEDDFVYWAKWVSEEATNPNNKEYPEWDVVDGAGKYIYDENIRKVWDARTDLHPIFSDGHYKTESVSGYHEMKSMLDWARFYGYKERPQELGNYHNWPYIGTYKAIYSSIPYNNSFDSGNSLAYNWITKSSNESKGRIQTTTSNTPHSGARHLTMDVNTNGNDSTNEAWLHLDLSQYTTSPFVVLEFWWKEFSDETHSEDGVYISDNGGSNFTKILNLDGKDLNGNIIPNKTWHKFNIDLDQKANQNGLYLNSTFVIKFQQRDNYSISTDGFAFDDVTIYNYYNPLNKISNDYSSTELIPEKYVLYQNYPNPFNPSTTIKYSLKEDTFVELSVYDMTGRKVKTLVNQAEQAGYKAVVWQGVNDNGVKLASGTYIYQIKTKEYIKAAKLILLK